MADFAINTQPFKYYVVVDFECTCEKDNRDYENEIIEWPAVLVDSETIAVLSEFRHFVRPTKNFKLSDFCTQLTGVTQAQVDAAGDLQATMADFTSWLTSQGCTIEPKQNFALVTDGPWDLRNFLSEECKRKGLTSPSYCNRWVNIRWLFAECFKTSRCNLSRMLSKCGLTFQGQPHCGIDDTRNIARIAIHMLQKKFKLVINDSLATPIDGNRNYKR